MKKLGLKKKIISSLSDAEMARVYGGVVGNERGSRDCATRNTSCCTTDSVVANCPSLEKCLTIQ